MIYTEVSDLIKGIRESDNINEIADLVSQLYYSIDNYVDCDCSVLHVVKESMKQSGYANNITTKIERKIMYSEADTTSYYVILHHRYTVTELIREIILAFPNEHGCFTLMTYDTQTILGRYKYSGKDGFGGFGNYTKLYSDLKVLRVKAHGGFSAMDYTIVVVPNYNSNYGNDLIATIGRKNDASADTFDKVSAFNKVDSSENGSIGSAEQVIDTDLNLFNDDRTVHISKIKLQTRDTGSIDTSKY